MIEILFALAAATTVQVGGIGALPLPADAVGVQYQGEPALVVAGRAIVPVPVNAPLGARHVTVQTRTGERRIEFVVVAKEFPEQHLTIANPRLVNPLAEDMPRIRRERRMQDEAYARRTETRPQLAPFAQPVTGIVSSEFGFRRVYNGTPRSRHLGLDIAAVTGTPVLAPAPAAVAVTGDFFFNGKTVLLDHGGGLVTMYCHLDRVDVEGGAEVARGDAIGTVGATGRATGPHLHWTVSLQNVRVDPQQAMAVFNALAGGE